LKTTITTVTCKDFKLSRGMMVTLHMAVYKFLEKIKSFTA